MTNFETTLHELINLSPFITAALAAVGLATVCWLLWSGLKQIVGPVLGYLVSGPRQMMSFWLYIMIVGGGSAWGYSQQDIKGLWLGLGITSLLTAAATVILYWIRQWVGWYYNEK